MPTKVDGVSARIGILLEHRYFLPLITVAGVLFRLCLVILLRHNHGFPDEFEYQAIGVSLWKHGTFAVPAGLTAYRPPAEPMLIALFYSLFGQHPIGVKVLEAILLGGLPLLCAALGKSLGLSVRATNVGALLASFHPGLAYAATTLYPTVLTAFGLTAGVVFSARAVKEQRTSWAFLSGIGLAIAGFATTTFVPMSLMIGGYCLLKRTVRIGLIIAVVGVLPSLCWMVRNHNAFGAWTLATNGGINLYIGANDEATPTSENWLPAPFYPGQDEIAQDHAYAARAKNWIHAHTAHYALVSLGRAVLVVDSVGNPRTQGVHSGLAAHLVGWCMIPITVLGFVGLGLYWRTTAGSIAIFALLLVVASCALTLVKPRFRFPCDPLLGTFAAAAVSKIGRKAVRSEQLPMAVVD